MESTTRKTAVNIFRKALTENAPSALVQKSLTVDSRTITVNGRVHTVTEVEADSPVFVLAVGKASVPMGQALKEQLQLADDRLLCISPNAHPDLPFVTTASHPIPDETSRAAAEKLLAFLRAIPTGGTVFFALSGGASALICKPAEGLELKHLNQMNRLLIESGANIRQINSVRKHLSAIKGGQLLTYLSRDCTLIDLVISDVPGDDLSIIGSGPTTPDASTFEEARQVLQQYELWPKVPEPVRVHIRKGLQGKVRETVKPGNDPLKRHEAVIIGSAGAFAGSVAEAARELGYEPWVAPSAYDDPVEEVVRMVSEKISTTLKTKPADPQALVFYGESTVQVTGGGKGGRNQELALRGALQIEGRERVTWLSAGTDGIDGPTDAAGAVVDGATAIHAREQGIDPQQYIRANDSYHFHQQMGTLLKTGPTGNNMMDVVVVLVEAEG